MSVEASPIGQEIKGRSREQLTRAIVDNSARPLDDQNLLGANRLFLEHHDLRAAGNIGEIRHQARAMVERFDEIDIHALSPQQKKSLHRTLSMGITLAVLPQDKDVDVIPGASRALLRIAAETGHAPRSVDPIYVGEHPFRYIKTKQNIEVSEAEPKQTVYTEDIVKIAGFEALSGQGKLVQCMEEAVNYEVLDPRFAQSLRHAAEPVSRMVVAIAVVRKHLDLNVFMGELVPFFEKIVVGGREVLHSESQTIGPLVADPVLGIVTPAEFDTGPYGKYHELNISYALEEDRRRFAAMKESLAGTTIIDRTLSEIPGYMEAPEDVRDLVLSRSYKNISPQLREAILAEYDLLTKIYSFRTPHNMGVNKSRELAPNRTGTGGAIHMPGILLKGTERAMHRLHSFVEEHKKAIAA